jgi:hypothetical protein
MPPSDRPVSFLLPPSVREWLPENHLVYFVSDVIDNLNPSALDTVYGDEQRGQPPYDPRMMTKVCLGPRVEPRAADLGSKSKDFRDGDSRTTRSGRRATIGEQNQGRIRRREVCGPNSCGDNTK